MLRYDEYWWNLAQLFNPKFSKGQHVLPSGIILLERQPKESLELENTAIDDFQRAFTADTERKKKLQMLQKLQEKVEMHKSRSNEFSEKANETAAKIKEVQKLVYVDSKSVNLHAQKIRTRVEEHKGSVYCNIP